VKLLYDQNLSHRLVPRLETYYPNSIHVRDVGLSSADDIEVWTFAASDGFVIVSKDADFYDLSLRLGHPPKLVWIRRGNCSTDEIAVILRDHQLDLLAFEQDTGAGSLILY
jgi:predicted nuclease of predicted toxin-antitoxin system